ncbi:MAG TPA: nucleoside phosphorylase [Bacteroidales bacterium]|nr:nucleoside phosphorylase [Bacteroidales bacterium]
MARLSESELVLNQDGSVYHLKLQPEQIAPVIILVGDPGRVEAVSKHFDRVEIKTQNREIITHTGYCNRRHLTVMSTGMGTDNIDIIVNELDALVNIDLKSREVKGNLTSLKLIRIGTSGAVQPEIALNSFVASSYAIGLDGLLHFYSTNHQVFDKHMANAFSKHMQWPAEMAAPYAVKASSKLLQHLGYDLLSGITATAPGFYAPQGRKLRLGYSIPDMNLHLESFRFDNLKICNFEMETSALYGLAGLLGHEALTVCVAIANRHTKDFNKDYKAYIDRLIQLTLERITSMPE